MTKIISIIVTYNGEQYIGQCLESLLLSTVKTEIIVIDNGSADGTIEIIKSYFPQVDLVAGKDNVGFGKANNVGIRMAMEKGAHYFFLLNQDARVEANTIENLVEIAKSNSSLGIVSPLHLNGAGKSFDKNFYSYLLKSDIENFLSTTLLNSPLYQPCIYTKFVNAAAWLVSRQCISSVGGFDPLFFHYGEDRNYCHRVIYKGFKIGIVLTAKVYHDREKKDIIKRNLAQRIEHDFMNFKVDASNIRRGNIFFFIAKKIIRHFTMGICYLFVLEYKRTEYHFQMLVLILPVIASIYACRKRARSNLLFA